MVQPQPGAWCRALWSRLAVWCSAGCSSGWERQDSRGHSLSLGRWGPNPSSILTGRVTSAQSRHSSERPSYKPGTVSCLTGPRGAEVRANRAPSSERDPGDVTVSQARLAPALPGLTASWGRRTSAAYPEEILTETAGKPGCPPSRIVRENANGNDGEPPPGAHEDGGQHTSGGGHAAAGGGEGNGAEPWGPALPCPARTPKGESGAHTDPRAPVAAAGR